MCLTGLVALRHVGSSQTRARTRVPCTSRQILNHCATREALDYILIKLGKKKSPLPSQATRTQCVFLREEDCPPFQSNMPCQFLSPSDLKVLLRPTREGEPSGRGFEMWLWIAQMENKAAGSRCGVMCWLPEDQRPPVCQSATRLSSCCWWFSWSLRVKK